MLRHINILDIFKKGGALLVGLGLAVFSFASVSMPAGDGGGDGDKAPKTSTQFSFSPLKVRDNLFTLKAGPFYRGNNLFEEEKHPASVTVTDAITYQKGNITYILPYRHKVFLSGATSNLQAINLKFNLSR